MVSTDYSQRWCGRTEASAEKMMTGLHFWFLLAYVLNLWWDSGENIDVQIVGTHTAQKLTSGLQPKKSTCGIGAWET